MGCCGGEEQIFPHRSVHWRADTKFVLNNCRVRSPLLIILQCYLKSFILYIINVAMYKK